MCKIEFKRITYIKIYITLKSGYLQKVKNIRICYSTTIAQTFCYLQIDEYLIYERLLYYAFINLQ